MQQKMGFTTTLASVFIVFLIISPTVNGQTSEENNSTQYMTQELEHEEIIENNCIFNGNNEEKCTDGAIPNCVWCADQGICVNYNPCTKNYIHLLGEVQCARPLYSPNQLPCAEPFMVFWLMVLVYGVVFLVLGLSLYLGCKMSLSYHSCDVLHILVFAVVETLTWIALISVLVGAIVYFLMGYLADDDIQVQVANQILGWGLLGVIIVFFAVLIATSTVAFCCKKRPWTKGVYETV